MCVDGAGTRYLAFSQGRSRGSGMMCEEAGTLSSNRGIPCIASTGQKLQGSCLGFIECYEKARPESLIFS